MNNQQIKALLRSGKATRHVVGDGLILKVTATGKGFWRLRYSANGKRREMTLGEYGPLADQLTLAEATAKAAMLRAKIASGSGFDPLAEKKRAAVATAKTVNDLAELWLSANDKRLKHPGIPRSAYKRNIQPTIGELAVDRVTARDVHAVVEAVKASGRPTVANDALGYIKQMFNYGIRHGLCETNPAQAFTVKDAGGIEQPRNRTLSVREIGQVFTVFSENATAFSRENYLAVAILLTTAVRKGELLAARWDEFDADAATWRIPAERTKTKQAVTVPLAAPVLAWFEELRVRAFGSEFVFPRRRADAKARSEHTSLSTINAAMNKLEFPGMAAWTIHDLRRTCRTLLSEYGVASHVAERCLNHKLKGVEGIYDRYDYLDERREALAKVADALAPVINQVPNVTPFRRRKA